MRDRDFTMNRYFGALAAILMASIPCLAEARVATLTGEIQPSPAPLCSRAATLSSWSTEPLEQEWPASRPAAKVQADDCPSVDVVALEGDALIDYLRTTSEDCLKRTFYISDNPSIRGDVPTIFSDRNMQSVFAEIEESAATYDGTNSTGMLQLWSFVELGYSYHRFFPGESGVGPFDEATDRAYLAASDAFAASDQFHAPNDEAARILYYYFENAFSAGLRQNHLAPIKQVLSGLTPERAVSGDQAWAPQPWAFITVLRRVHGAFLDNNQEFINALAQDPEFVDVMLQVTRYDFFFFVEEEFDPREERLVLLEKAVHILVRLTRLESLKESAVAALTSVLSWHERLSSPFLVAARGLENQVDCSSLNICRDVLESEIFARGLPNTYRFDDGALVFETSLDLEAVQPMYQAAKEVQAQFHRLVETDEAARDDRDVFTARIYGTRSEYAAYERYLFNVDTRGINKGGFYRGGTMGIFVTPGNNRDNEDRFRHEYAHYLADRFGLHGGPWFDEGLAEFLVGSTQAEGIPVRWTLVLRIDGDETRLDPAGLFDSRYSADLGGGRFYYYAGLFFHFMHQQRRTELFELLDVVRDGDASAYHALIATWAGDAQLAADYAAFLDVQVDNFAFAWSEPPPPITTSFPRWAALTSDSAAEIDRALQRIDSDLGLNCQSVEAEFEHRFECTGSLPAESQFSGDRGALNKHFNARLDGFMASAVDHEEINNFEYMTCYFTNVAGSPPVADLYCEGPLRPADLAAARVDLKTTLVNHSGDSNANVGERLRFWTTLDFSEEAASNVTLTWSASLPVSVSAEPCEIVERTEQTGTLACGHVYNESEAGPHLVLTLYLYPLEAGSLDFSVAFSADEEEIEPADNAASLQWMIALTPHHIATLEGHTGWVLAVAFSPPDGTMLASGADDRTIKLWDVATETNIATLEGYTGWVLAVAFSPPDGTILASGADDRTIKLWDVATETNIATLEGHTGWVRSVAFSPDGTMLASGADDQTVKLWDVDTETNIATFEHTGPVRSVAFSPDGTMLASGSEDGTVKLWDVATETNIATLEGHTKWVNSVAFSPDGTMLASGADDRTVQLWDVDTETNTATFGHTGPVRSVAFSPDGTILASGADDETVKLWDVATETNIATLEGHTDPVFSVAFSPDGTMLVSGAADQTVKLWDASEWTRPRPRTLVRISDVEQQGPAGAQLAEPFVVAVRDQNGNLLEGVQVTFAVTDGAGTLSVATDTTGANGQATSTLTLGSQPGTNTVEVTVAGLEPVTFTAVGKATPDFDGDGVVGFADFFLFVDAFDSTDPRFDLDASGRVDFDDFFLFADHFGQPAQAKLLVLAQELIGLPDGPQLRQNAPNPFNSQTVISYFLLATGPARLELFALTGQRVAVLSRGQQKAGRHRLHWDGRDDEGRPLASGIYLYRLVTDEGIRTRKLTLLR